MAELTTNTAVSASFGAGFLNTVNRVFAGFVALGENTSRARAIEALGQVSDEQLEAKGTTRKDEVLRILGASAFI